MDEKQHKQETIDIVLTDHFNTHLLPAIQKLFTKASDSGTIYLVHYEANQNPPPYQEEFTELLEKIIQEDSIFYPNKMTSNFKLNKYLENIGLCDYIVVFLTSELINVYEDPESHSLTNLELGVAITSLQQNSKKLVPFYSNLPKEKMPLSLQMCGPFAINNWKEFYLKLFDFLKMIVSDNKKEERNTLSLLQREFTTLVNNLQKSDINILKPLREKIEAKQLAAILRTAEEINQELDEYTDQFTKKSQTINDNNAEKSQQEQVSDTNISKYMEKLSFLTQRKCGKQASVTNALTHYTAKLLADFSQLPAGAKNQFKEADDSAQQTIDSINKIFLAN